jgi:hypothetical protein
MTINSARAAPASGRNGSQKKDRLTGTINSTVKIPVGVGQLPLSCIKDGGAQMRVEMRVETVNDYAEDMLAGATFPPVVVFFDGTDYWLGDGFHRVEAARKIERETIDAEIRQGTLRDAILCGIGANAFHGLRRTQADIRRAVKFLVTDPEWSRLSDRKLGEIANVDHKTIGKYRRELSGEIPHPRRKLNGGETPRQNGKPSGNSGSVLADMLKAVSDDALVAECRRRGFVVEAADA